MTFFETYKNLLNYYVLNEHVVDQVPRKELGMSNSVQDLPDVVPYGFWIDKSGNFLEVRRYGHEEGLTSILGKAANYLQQNQIEFRPRYAYMEMYRMGWFRVVISEYGGIKYQNDISEVQPTTPQMKFLKFIKELYEIERLGRD